MRNEKWGMMNEEWRMKNEEWRMKNSIPRRLFESYFSRTRCGANIV